MKDPVGFSFLYPAVPILDVFAIVCMLAIAPAMFKTRIVCVQAIVVWLLVGSLSQFVGMVRWRGNIDDMPVFADILCALQVMWRNGLWIAMACYGRFLWQMSRPRPSSQVCDNRRKQNIIEGCATIVVPILLVPTYYLYPLARYDIMEDLGPSYSFQNNWVIWILVYGPLLLPSAIMAIFSALSFWSFLTILRRAPFTDCYAVSRARKLAFASLCNGLLSVYSIVFNLYAFFLVYPVGTDLSVWSGPDQYTKNLGYVIYSGRFAVDQFLSAPYISAVAASVVSTPLVAFYHFVWFGFGKKSREGYTRWWKSTLTLFRIKEGPEKTQASSSTSKATSWISLPLIWTRQRRGHMTHRSPIIGTYIDGQVFDISSPYPSTGTMDPSSPRLEQFYTPWEVLKVDYRAPPQMSGARSVAAHESRPPVVDQALPAGPEISPPPPAYAVPRSPIKTRLSREDALSSQTHPFVDRSKQL